MGAGVVEIGRGGGGAGVGEGGGGIRVTAGGAGSGGRGALFEINSTGAAWKCWPEESSTTMSAGR